MIKLHNHLNISSNYNGQIVLIGMPGSGKTTIGKIVSSKLNIPFYDIDEYIEHKTGKSIKELFTNGEEYFRFIETEAIKEVAAFSPCVISTGGGVVIKHRNMEILSKALIVYINRPLENIIKDIDFAARPLLNKNPDKIFDLYKKRSVLYKKYSDYEIPNDKTIDDAVKKIIEIAIKTKKYMDK